MKLPLLILSSFFSTAAIADLNDMVSNDGVLPTITTPVTKIDKGNKGIASSTVTTLKAITELNPLMLATLNNLPSLQPNTDTRAVFGVDARAKIFTNTYPMRAVALITVQTAQISGKCTGWFIGANTVVTAGHCVHQGQNGAWYPVEAYTVYPGYDGSNAPYGKCTVKRLYSTVGWTTNSNAEHDYAALKLNCTLGNTTGWFGYGVYNSVKNLPAIVNGYPADKTGLWGSASVVSKETTTRAYYKTDTTGGMSGSPVWHDSNYGPLGIAIHTYQSGTLNSGTRINSSVFKNLKNWKLAN